VNDAIGPLPILTEDALPYWEGCREQRLMIQRCTQCGVAQFYPRNVCAACGDPRVEFIESSGRGVVHTFTVCHRALTERFAGGPYAIALVDLDEGPRLMSNIVGTDVEDVHIGQRVHVVFQRLTDDITIPQFVPEEHS
jgi:uncharacterized OB-fold protein